MRIVKDYQAFCSKGGIGKKFSTLFFNPCFHSVCLFRLSNLFYKIHLSVISKIIWYINRMLFHVDIDYRADLAGGFVLVHGLGTVIGKEVKSEGRLMVYQGVTLGGNNNRTQELDDGTVISQPLIKKNVKIYTNASVFGPVVISEDTIVKAHSVVTHNI